MRTKRLYIPEDDCTVSVIYEENALGVIGVAVMKMKLNTLVIEFTITQYGGQELTSLRYSLIMGGANIFYAQSHREVRLNNKPASAS